MAASEGQSADMAEYARARTDNLSRFAMGTGSVRKLIPTAAIALLLSFLAGALSTIVIKDLTGSANDWLFWTVAGVCFVAWIVEERRLRS
jgi:hypothetical protein